MENIIVWSLPLGKERRLRLFEDKVVWKIFGPVREEDAP
jgi:hypothetical protein